MFFVLPSTEAQFIPNKQLQPKETQIYIKLVKYAMQALDIYQVGLPTESWRRLSTFTKRVAENK